MTVMVLYAVLVTALYYLANHAEITSFLWSRYPPRMARWVGCPSCAGAWFGAAIGIAGRELGLAYAGLPSTAWSTPIVVAGVSIVTTPILVFVMGTAISRLVPPGHEDDAAP